MKLLYILAAVMFTGLLMLTVSSYKVLSAAKEAQLQGQPATGVPSQQPPRANPDMAPYIMMSYLGITLFIVGGVGAIFFAFKAMSHRF